MTDHEQIYDEQRDHWLLIDKRAGRVVKWQPAPFDGVPEYQPLAPPAPPHKAEKKGAKR
jgi:hypothetical protein